MNIFCNLLRRIETISPNCFNPVETFGFLMEHSPLSCFLLSGIKVAVLVLGHKLFYLNLTLRRRQAMAQEGTTKIQLVEERNA